MSAPAAISNARQDFYARAGSVSLAPLWESMQRLVPP